MKWLPKNFAALEETKPPELREVLAFKQVFGRVLAVIPEFDLVYARGGQEKQYALIHRTPAGPGLDLSSGLREGVWLHLTVDARKGRVLSFVANAASAVRQGKSWTSR